MSVFRAVYELYRSLIVHQNLPKIMELLILLQGVSVGTVLSNFYKMRKSVSVAWRLRNVSLP